MFKTGEINKYLVHCMYGISYENNKDKYESLKGNNKKQYSKNTNNDYMFRRM